MVDRETAAVDDARAQAEEQRAAAAQPRELATAVAAQSEIGEFPAPEVNPRSGSPPVGFARRGPTSLAPPGRVHPVRPVGFAGSPPGMDEVLWS